MRKKEEHCEYIKSNFRYNPETGIVTRFRNSNRWGVYDTKDVECGTESHGYLRTMVLRKSFANHRIAWFLMTGAFPEDLLDIDHINGDRRDNRWSNLRLARRGQNNMNSGNPGNNTSGQKGVHKNRDNGWYARIKVDGKVIHLGVFKEFCDAVKARRDAETRCFGEFTRTL